MLRVEALRAIHRHHHHRGVVDVGIMRIGVLERPAARAHVRPPRDPIALDVEHLIGPQPFEPLHDPPHRLLVAGLQQRVAGEPGVPDRRHAGLAIGLVRMHGQELLDRPAGDRARRIVRRIAERVEHHHAVGHRREDRAETVLAVEPLAHPGLGERNRALPRALGKQRLGGVQHVVDSAEEPEPRRLLLRRLLAPAPRSAAARGTARRSGYSWGCAPAACSAISTSIGTMTVRLQYEILSRWNGNHRGSSMISTGIAGTARQGMKPNSASITLANTLARAAPPRARMASRARAICGASIGSPIDLEREIGLHARAHVEGAVVEQRPAAVRRLVFAADSSRSFASSSASTGSPR